ncbi:MAG: hypothetical protein KatS3mg043_0864 [Rhodothermaceae bacterium]|nr:MAG: hypothetical protein KatS3mg043_0864 [Rhodothermaceae bacterium]
MLELRLDDGDGTMTIKARRDAERVIVAVSFSDPHLRLLASENADRLQEALRQQYDASVDLSLAGEDAGASSRHHENGQDSPASFARVSRVHDREAGAGPVLRRAGARHVWVG